MTAFADARQFDVTLPDGRRLHCYEAGDPAGALLVYHHGTPTSGMLARSWADDARERGLRLVGYDRAGYGGSTRHPGRTVADVAADISVLVDHLEADRFYSWGVSGGGPHLLACAALLGERVIAAASLASVAPYDAEQLDFLAGMGEDNLQEFGAALEGAAPLTTFLEEQRRDMLDSSPEQLTEVMSSLLPDVDKAALTGDVAELLHGSVANGLRDGIDGWLDDDLAFVSPWGFDPAEIEVPLLIMQGEQDLMVPYAHGRWLASHVPAATTRLSATDGHVSILAKMPEVHAWLLAAT